MGLLMKVVTYPVALLAGAVLGSGDPLYFGALATEPPAAQTWMSRKVPAGDTVAVTIHTDQVFGRGVAILVNDRVDIAIARDGSLSEPIVTNVRVLKVDLDTRGLRPVTLEVRKGEEGKLPPLLFDGRYRLRRSAARN
jgi:hypothetical protein